MKLNKIKNLLKNLLYFFYILRGLGIGDWGLGIGDWGPIPNPQSPIPNPQSPHLMIQNFNLKNLYNLYIIL
jgi:hypothetical protein